MASPKPSLIDFKHLKAAEGFVELGMYLEAEDELGQIDPYCLIDPQVLRVRLELYAGLQNWGLMQMVARRLTQRDPGKVQWRISLAYATRRAESLEAAKSILIDALESHPEEGIVHYNLACYDCQLGNLNDAKKHLTQATKADEKFKSMALDDADLEPLWREISVS